MSRQLRPACPVVPHWSLKQGADRQDEAAKNDRRQYPGGRQPLPGPHPLNELATGVPDLPDGQVNLRHGHDGQVQALDHMPTPPDHLTTGGRPPGLTRFACPILFKTTRRPNTGDLPPEARLPDGEGRSEGESFALPRRGTVWELSPLDLPDGAGVSLGANRTGGSLLEPRSWDRPTPPPVAAL